MFGDILPFSPAEQESLFPQPCVHNTAVGNTCILRAGKTSEFFLGQKERSHSVRTWMIQRPAGHWLVQLVGLSQANVREATVLYVGLDGLNSEAGEGN